MLIVVASHAQKIVHIAAEVTKPKHSSIKHIRWNITPLMVSKQEQQTLEIMYECIHIIPETEKKFIFKTAVLLLRIMMKLTNRFHVAMRMRSNK